MGMNAPTAAIARPKGPIVWLDADQQQLDDAYDQLVYAPNRDQLAKRRVANSAAARAWLGEPLRFAYGPMPTEALMSIDRSRIVLPPSVQEHPSPSSSGMYDLKPGTAVEALEIRKLHRRDGARAVRHPASRQARDATHSQLRHLRETPEFQL